MKIPKILIVDDIPENLKAIISILKNTSLKYSLFQAISGSDALEIIESTDIDLIITDWDMPIIDGIELIKRVKANPTKKDIPVIIATGTMITSEDLKTALNAGAIDYVRKPIDPIELFARIQSILKISEYHKQILDLKDKELTESSLFLVKNNKFNSIISSQLKSVKCVSPKDNKLIESVIYEVDKKVKADSWQRFNLAFESVNKEFTEKITIAFPSLSDSELKLVTLIKLGMKTKEIADVLYKTPDSVKVARYRVRKKLGLLQEQSLYVFITTF